MSQQITASQATTPREIEAIPEEIVKCESRNILILVTHQVTLRIAWIFKTESVIMPAFMDVISGAGWMRGCLPVLNQITQGIAPIFFAPVLRNAPRKKWSLVWTTACMALTFLSLAMMVLFLGARVHPWLPYAFLVLYTFFFCATGLNQLANGTIRGKLIRPERRGRLMALSGIVGSSMAMLAAWFLLQAWLDREDGGFWLIFSFTGCVMLLSAAIAAAVNEPVDPARERLPVRTNPFRNAWRLVKADRHLRRLIYVAMLFMCTMFAFPHYQKLGRNAADFTPGRLMVWVVAQNGGAGLLSLLAGSIADRYGNRLALRLGILGAALTPLLALALSEYAPGGMFWLTFMILGCVPTTLKTIVNYTLELTDSSQHPQYISTVRLCMGLPLVFAPFFGLLVEPDQLGFRTIFIGVSAVTFLGVLLTFKIIEPRTAR